MNHPEMFLNLILIFNCQQNGYANKINNKNKYTKDHITFVHVLEYLKSIIPKNSTYHGEHLISDIQFINLVPEKLHIGWKEKNNCSV